MSKAVLICHRDISSQTIPIPDFTRLSSRILPDNCIPAKPQLFKENGVCLGLINPNACLLIENCSVCLGQMFEQNDYWHIPGTVVPDGSYAIIRSNAEYIELVTDVVASRSIWYYHDDDLFIASTSQRAIIVLLGSFSLNGNVIPWMLSTGSLGPSNSWDARLNLLPGDSVLKLDRKSWEITIHSNKCEFFPDSRSETTHKRDLSEALRDTFDSIQIDYSHWGLPLSGGCDSRAILFLLGMPPELKCITWGTESSVDEKGNDAFIARKLAEKYQLEHEFFESSRSDETAEIIFDRFLNNSEGRIDHISAYLDGFNIWNTISRSGIDGMLRGDEGFGWSEVFSEEDVRVSVGLTLLSDFGIWKDLQDFDLEPQRVSENLQRRHEETLQMWRDRMYHDFRIPVILAALSDAKLSYVELINPLLSKRILNHVRTMPDNLRTEKRTFRKIVKSYDRDIAFARYSAIENPHNFLRRKDVVAILRTELHSQFEESILPEAYLHYLLQRIDEQKEYKAKGSLTLARRIKPLVPGAVRRRLQPLKPKNNLDLYELAFRTFIIGRMNRLLKADAEFLR